MDDFIGNKPEDVSPEVLLSDLNSNTPTVVPENIVSDTNTDSSTKESVGSRFFKKFFHKPSKKRILLLGLALLLLISSGFAVWYYRYRSTLNNSVQTSSRSEVIQYTEKMLNKAAELDQAKSTDAKNTNTITTDLVEVSEQRKEKLLILLDQDPTAFLSVAEPSGFVDKLPEAVAANTEREFDGEGTLQIILAEKDTNPDNNSYGDGKNYYFLKQDGSTDDQMLQVYFSSAPDISMSGKKIKVRGIKLGNKVAAKRDNASLSPAQSNGTVVAGVSTIQYKKVAVIMVNFSTNPIQTASPSQLSSLMFSTGASVKSYYNEASYGAINITGDVYGWYTINANQSTCDFYNWGVAAKTAAQNAGVNLGIYTNVMIMWPSQLSVCGFGGIAAVNGAYSYINGSRNFLLKTTSHELGHNFGVLHASTYYCVSNGVRVTISDSCTADEYGDPFDIMGQANDWVHTYHPSTYEKSALKVLSSANVQTVTSGTYKIVQSSTVSSGIQELRVPRTYDSLGNVTEFYSLEIRGIYGFDNFNFLSPPTLGASIRLASNPPGSKKTYLLDTTPDTATYLDSPLFPGKSFIDSKNGITIKAISVDGTGLVVTVTAPAPPAQVPPATRKNPTVVINPSSQWVEPGKAATYTVSITNNDSSIFGTSSFKLSSVVPSGFSQNPSTTSVSILPGATAVVNISLTSSNTVANGLYNFSNTVVNGMNSNYSTTATSSINVYKQDTAAPVVTISQPADGTTLKTKQNLIATATSSVVIAKVEVYVNDVLKKTIRTSSTNNYTYGIDPRKLTAGSNTITVKAYDSNGSTTSKSISVIK